MEVNELLCEGIKDHIKLIGQDGKLRVYRALGEYVSVSAPNLIGCNRNDVVYYIVEGNRHTFALFRVPPLPPSN